MYSHFHHKIGEALPVGTVLHKADLEELHYLVPIENLANILKYGILSHRRVIRLGLKVTDISNSEVQDRRELVRVPRADVAKGTLKLHRHVNFYLNAHNAMMYVRKQEHERLCVLRIHREILDRPDAMLSTQNAATAEVAFFSPRAKSPLYSPRSTQYLTVERTQGFGLDCTEGKPIRQAEALFPYQVDSSYIGGIFVSCESSRDMVYGVLASVEKNLSVTVHPSLFFQGKTRYVSLERFDPLPILTDAERGKLRADLPESSDSDEEQITPPAKRGKFGEESFDAAAGLVPK